MKKVLRVSGYPTFDRKSMGRNSYMISGMNSIKTFFVATQYSGTPLPEPKNTKLYRFPFLTVPSPSGFKRIPHECKRIVKIVSFTLRTLRVFWRHNPDIVHIHSPMFFLVALIAKILGKRCYITFHGREHELIYKNRLLGLLFNSVFHKTFSLSTSIESYGKLFPRYSDNYIVIDNAVDKTVFFDKGGRRENIILAVGRLEYQKDYPTLFRAFCDFLVDYPSYELHIVGEGQLNKDLRDLATNLGIENSVKFLGMVAQEELPDIYNNAEVFALSSFWEGFPKVLLEAMACGCKVVSTKIDSVPRVLGSNYPYLVNSGDHSGLAAKFRDIIEQDQSLALSYVATINKYSWLEIMARMEEEYNS